MGEIYRNITALTNIIASFLFSFTIHLYICTNKFINMGKIISSKFIEVIAKGAQSVDGNMPNNVSVNAIKAVIAQDGLCMVTVNVENIQTIFPAQVKAKEYEGDMPSSPCMMVTGGMLLRLMESYSDIQKMLER